MNLATNERNKRSNVAFFGSLKFLGQCRVDLKKILKKSFLCEEILLGIIVFSLSLLIFIYLSFIM